MSLVLLDDGKDDVDDKLDEDELVELDSVRLGSFRSLELLELEFEMLEDEDNDNWLDESGVLKSLTLDGFDGDEIYVVVVSSTEATPPSAPLSALVLLTTLFI